MRDKVGVMEKERGQSKRIFGREEKGRGGKEAGKLLLEYAVYRPLKRGAYVD